MPTIRWQVRCCRISARSPWQTTTPRPRKSTFGRGSTAFRTARWRTIAASASRESLEKQEKLAEAEKIYQVVANKSGSRLAEDAQLRLGVVQNAMGKYADAAESFQAFETKWAQSRQIATVRLGRGWALLKLDRPAEAAVLFEKIVADPKVGVEARYWLGLAQKAEKHLVRRRQNAHRSRGRRSPTIRCLRPCVFMRATHCSAAAMSMQRARSSISFFRPPRPTVRGSPTRCSESSKRPRGRRMMRRSTGERPNCSSVFPKSPAVGDAKRILARSQIQRKLYSKAVETLEPLLADGGPDASAMEARYLLALAEEGQKRYAEALAALQPVLASADGQLKADARLTEASLRMAMKQYDNAVAPFEEYLASQPSGDAAVQARGNLAICYARSKQIDKAKRLYVEISEKPPTAELHEAVTEQLAEAAYDAGDTAWSNELFAWVAKHGRSEKQLTGLSGLGVEPVQSGEVR